MNNQYNGIPGVRSLTSVSRQGGSNITVEFELSVDLETAANDVRDKVSQAMRMLPRDCDPPTVAKADADANPILFLTVESDKRSLLELSEIADLTFKEQLQTISGVSAVSIFGRKTICNEAMDRSCQAGRLSADPTGCQKCNITVKMLNLPSGTIEGTNTQLTIRTLGSDDNSKGI